MSPPPSWTWDGWVSSPYPLSFQNHSVVSVASDMDTIATNVVWHSSVESAVGPMTPPSAYNGIKTRRTPRPNAPIVGKSITRGISFARPVRLSSRSSRRSIRLRRTSFLLHLSPLCGVGRGCPPHPPLPRKRPPPLSGVRTSPLSPTRPPTRRLPPHERLPPPLRRDHNRHNHHRCRT